MTVTPNFLYIGTSKAGSTWIFKVLSAHHQIYVTPSKGLYFFCEHFDRGWDWYCSQFQPGPQHKIISEISHSYLFSPTACQRISDLLPRAKLMVCLREPAERAYSQYLDGIKNGKMHGTFEEELERTPALIERSCYAAPLRRYIAAFGRSQIHVTFFDDLARNPSDFAERVFRFLSVESMALPPRLQGKVLPAGTPRLRGLAMLAKKLSHTAKRVGLVKLRGKAKTSPFIRNLLYRPYTKDSRPTMCEETRARLRERFAGDVRELDSLLGTDACRRWGYCEGNVTCPAPEPAGITAVGNLQEADSSMASVTAQ